LENFWQSNFFLFSAITKPNDCIFPYDFKEKSQKEVYMIDFYCKKQMAIKGMKSHPDVSEK